MKYNNEEDFKKSKNELMRILGVSNDNQLANILGYTSNSAIAEWNKKLSIPDKILRKYYDKSSIVSDKKQTYQKSSTLDLVTINLYEDIYASAGYGNHNGDIIPIQMQFDKNFLRSFFNITKFDHLDIIRVVGDSMQPLIRDGEYIIVERNSSAKSGDTVIANIDGELYVKRLQKIPFEPWIKLESENKDYPSIIIDTDDKLKALTIIGIVKSKIKLF